MARLHRVTYPTAEGERLLVSWGRERSRKAATVCVVRLDPGVAHELPKGGFMVNVGKANVGIRQFFVSVNDAEKLTAFENAVTQDEVLSLLGLNELVRSEETKV